jgi:hypothetical protein
MTTPISSPPTAQPLILKTDARGRVLTPRDRREALLDEFERSGLSGAEYSTLVGIKYQTFATWAHRRRQQRGSQSASKAVSKAEQVRWLEAVVSDAQGSSLAAHNGLVLQLPGGARAEIVNLSQVPVAAALLQALGKALSPC